ncbi:MAG: NAD-dependent epimerase/dehydratase family protein [candidate division Zixibacteria bacterium]|nr:NAD-dependent epimerase/dehydratase family protein [candidate division Zixibacteria bacterium]
MELEGAKVLIIGGAGFIGSHVVEELAKEDVEEIIVYDNLSRGSMANLEEALTDHRVKVYELGGDILHGDILSEAMKGVDYVFHLAALWLLHCQEYPRAAFKVNIEGTFNVIEACVRNNVKRLVFSSSASVYGDALHTPMDESHPFNNKTFYGATKIAGEQMCRAFHHRFGLDYVGLRYMNVYGPRQDYKGAYIAVILRWLDMVERGESLVIYGDGSQTYDFIYVKDAARANILALKRGRPDTFYNVGSGEGTNLKKLAEILLSVIRRKDLGIRYESQGVTYVTHRIGSNRRAEEELGFTIETGLADGIRSLIEWRERDKKGCP